PALPSFPPRRSSDRPGPARVPLRNVAITFGAVAVFSVLACAVLAVAAAPPMAKAPPASIQAMADAPAALTAALPAADPAMAEERSEERRVGKGESGG